MVRGWRRSVDAQSWCSPATRLSRGIGARSARRARRRSEDWSVKSSSSLVTIPFRYDPPSISTRSKASRSRCSSTGLAWLAATRMREICAALAVAVDCSADPRLWPVDDPRGERSRRSRSTTPIAAASDHRSTAEQRDVHAVDECRLGRGHRYFRRSARRGRGSPGLGSETGAGRLLRYGARCSRYVALSRLPSTAMPMAPPSSRARSFMAEATPCSEAGSASVIEVVAGVMAVPAPAPSGMRPAAIIQYELSAVELGQDRETGSSDDQTGDADTHHPEPADELRGQPGRRIMHPPLGAGRALRRANCRPH